MPRGMFPPLESTPGDVLHTFVIEDATSFEVALHEAASIAAEWVATPSAPGEGGQNPAYLHFVGAVHYINPYVGREERWAFKFEIRRTQ